MEICVVDDDQDIRDMLRLALESIGYHAVIEVPDGATAPGVLRSRPHPCVVLLDLKMRHNGVTVLDVVANDPTLLERHAYIAVSADNSGVEAARPLLNRVGAPVVRKPFGLEDLQAQVAAAISQVGAA